MWVKQGRIFHLEPSPNRSTHCQVPTPYVFDDFIRVYYSCRNNGKSFVTYFDLAKDLKTILKVHEEPIFTHGKPGMFDADGVMPSCVIENDSDLWMYYIGWSELKNTARYQNEMGIAVSKDGGETFERIFDGPIMGRTPTEPGLAVMPFVRQQRNDLFAMWYQSGTGWELINGKYEPTYVIKYAQSHDGIRWERNPDACINPTYPLEAFSRPCVVKMGGYDTMLYCVRDSYDYRKGIGSYRIKCADSLDKINFMPSVDTRGITAGKEGEFDSEMQCYPYATDVDGRLVMFYNGNDFGQTGIGVAIWNS